MRQFERGNSGLNMLVGADQLDLELLDGFQRADLPDMRLGACHRTELTGASGLKANMLVVADSTGTRVEDGAFDAVGMQDKKNATLEVRGGVWSHRSGTQTT